MSLIPCTRPFFSRSGSFTAAAVEEWQSSNGNLDSCQHKQATVQVRDRQWTSPFTILLLAYAKWIFSRQEQIHRHRSCRDPRFIRQNSNRANASSVIHFKLPTNLHAILSGEHVFSSQYGLKSTTFSSVVFVIPLSTTISSIFFAILLTMFSSLATAGADDLPKRPLLFIPGMLGSKLCQGEKETNIVWGRSAEASLWNFESLALPLSETFEERQLRPCGIIESYHALGLLSLDQYSTLYDHLHYLGYSVPGRAGAARHKAVTRAQRFFAFDYDWRLSNFHNSQLLHHFIEKHLGEQAFDIIAHSMGGLIARLYLHRQAKESTVNRLITLGTPHRGALETLRTLDIGKSTWANWLAGGMDAIRSTLLSFPSFYELLPSYKCCYDSATLGHSIDLTSPLVWTTKLRRLLPKSFLTTTGEAFLSTALTSADELQTMMTAEIPVSHCLVATGTVSTVYRVNIGPEGQFINWVSGDGDGVVPEWSAANGTVADAKSSTQAHEVIYDNTAARQAIRRCLHDPEEPVSDGGMTVLVIPDAPSVSMRSVSLEMPYNLGFLGESVLFSVVYVGDLALRELDFHPAISVIHRNTKQELDDSQLISRSHTEHNGNLRVRFRFRTSPQEWIGTYDILVAPFHGHELLRRPYLVVERRSRQKEAE